MKCVMIEKSSKKIKEYFRAKKMLLHEKKTQFMLFHPSFSTFSSANVDIFVNNNNINAKHNTIACSRLTNGDYDSHVPFIKFLGVLKESPRFHLNTTLPLYVKRSLIPSSCLSLQKKSLP